MNPHPPPPRSTSLPHRLRLAPPARSTSLPSRLCLPSTSIDEDMSKLHLSVPPAVSFPALTRLYSSVEELLRSPSNRQALARLKGAQCVEHALDGYVHLLDACDTARKVLAVTKEHAQDVHSMLRRCPTNAVVARSVNAYLSCRNNAKKSINKCLKPVKNGGRGSCRSHTMVQDLPDVLMLLEDVKDASAKVLSSLLESLAPVRSLSLIARMIMRRKTAKKEGIDSGISELEVADAMVLELQSQLKWKKAVSWEMVGTAQRQMKELEWRMEELEKGVEGIFRSLIRNRVSLLNILSS